MIAILLGVAGIVFTVINVEKMAQMQNIQPDTMPAPEIVIAVLLIALPMCLAILLSVIGLVLGIIGLCQPRHKLFPIIGTCINGLLVVGCLFNMGLGMVVN
ncbi:MAG: hypothetical protein CMJ18_24855 [Phycisphaeraceae bacterium]|nr:hypothetical protein [Phycisphaeraceae bacterium]